MAAGTSSDRADTRPPSWAAMVVLTTIGVIGLAIGLGAGFPSLVAVVGGGRAMGTVVELQEQGRRGSAPVVRYQVQGTDYRIMASR